MARADVQTIRTAKANVARWFTETPVGMVFLPGDGSALPLSSEEAVAIRAGAETKIVEITRQVNFRVALHIVAIVTILIVVSFWKQGLDPSWRGAVEMASYALYTVHGLAAAHAFWRWERTIFFLREAIGHSLRARASLPPEIAGPLARAEPNYRLLGTIAFGLLGVLLIADTAPIFLGELAGDAAREIAGWLMAISIGGMAAIVFYVLGVTALRQLSDPSAKDRPRR